MRRIAVVGLTLSLLCTAGCYRATIRTPTTEVGERLEETSPTFIFGAVGTETDARTCANGLSRAEVYWPWWGGLVNVITFGLVTPVRMAYTCAAAPGAQAPVAR